MPLELKAYLVAGLIFAILDGVWLGLVARGFYASQMGDLMRAKFSIVPAVAFYVIYVAGLVVFAVLPGVEAGSVGRAALLGGLLGLVAYAAYDLSNLATLKNWPAPLAMLDLAWGTALSAASAAAAVWVLRMI